MKNPFLDREGKPLFTVTLSGRGKDQHQPVREFVESWSEFHWGNIDSIFAFKEFTPLYGGRTWNGNEISDSDYSWLRENGIGWRIPTTNILINEEIYKQNREFLEKYHEEGNTLIIARDTFAKLVKKDFPKYTIECSVIRNTTTIEQLEKRLEVYDTIVPDTWAFNHEMDLSKISDELKPRMRLFLNISCAYECKNRVCYGAISKQHLGQPTGSRCSVTEETYDLKAQMTTFNLGKFLDYGFRKFKVLRPRSFIETAY